MFAKCCLHFYIDIETYVYQTKTHGANFTLHIFGVDSESILGCHNGILGTDGTIKGGFGIIFVR